MSYAGSHNSDERADRDTLEVPCVLCPTSPFAAVDASRRCSIAVKRIQVDKLVYGGLGRWGQVFAGYILEADGLSPDDGPQPPVVIKLVDPLRFQSNDDDSDEDEPEEAARRMCESEAMSYAALVGVPVVPKWFGSYHCRRALEALDQLHQRKVYHRDIRPANVIVPSDKSRRVTLVFVDFGNALADETADLDDVPNDDYYGSEAYHASRGDYSLIARLLVGHFGVPDDDWKAWLRSIVPKTPVVRRAMDGWNIFDTVEEEAEDYRQGLRRLGFSELDIEAQVIGQFPTLEAVTV